MPPDSEQSNWFATHVLPHEPMLRAWLQSRFRDVTDFDDILQDAYLRVLRAHAEGGLQSPKAYLFAIARNLAVDRLRRQQIAATDSFADLDQSGALFDTDDVAETAARNQELELLTEAIQALPDRCRQVFTLRKIYGMSQKDIATKLGISEHTVSAQITIGIHKCTDFLRHRTTGARRHD